MKVPYLDLAAQMSPIRAEINDAINEVLNDLQFTSGYHVKKFEENFAKYCGTEFCCGVNSGTSALHLALRLLNINPGDEVITTSLTFIATSWAISYVGAKPVFVDIHPADSNINVKLIEAAITPKTKAIIIVHLYGNPCEMDKIMEIANKHGIPVVEDCAQAHGAHYMGKKVGTFGDIACFSFYPGKNLGGYGEGGALITNNKSYYDRACSLREHGSVRRYYHNEIGYNYRMDGIQGAILDVKLKYLPEWTSARKKVAYNYSDNLFREVPLGFPSEQIDSQSSWHLYVVRYEKRDELKNYLEEKGIGCGLHYPVPLHLQKCYEKLGYKIGDFPEAEKAANECLSLPIYPELSEEKQQYVIDSIKSFFNVKNT